mgnify:CR=1 FL=1
MEQRLESFMLLVKLVIDFVSEILGQMQLFLYKDTVANDYSVRQIEAMVKHWRDGKNKPAPNAKSKKELPQEFESLKIQLAKHFSTKVDISRSKNGKGRIVIPFTSSEDLNRIIEIFNE